MDAQPRWSIFASDMDIARLFEGNAALVLAGFFVFGLLLSFTPCVLPMIPILRRHHRRRGQAPRQVARLMLSVHLRAGHGARLRRWRASRPRISGSLLAAALQNVWVLGAFAAVFVLLALSMFGFYELQLPHASHQHLHTTQRLRGGRSPRWRRWACSRR